MDIKQTYNEWLENAVEDKDLTAELESIKKTTKMKFMIVSTQL